MEKRGLFFVSSICEISLKSLTIKSEQLLFEFFAQILFTSFCSDAYKIEIKKLQDDNNRIANLSRSTETAISKLDAGNFTTGTFLS